MTGEGTENIFTDLVIAILSVNNWSMEKVGVILPNLHSQQLTNPHFIKGSGFPEVFSRLNGAGYGRSEYITSLVTDRLLDLGRKYVDSGLETELYEAEIKRDFNRINQLLEPIHGVGPRVIDNYKVLRGIGLEKMKKDEVR